MIGATAVTTGGIAQLETHLGGIQRAGGRTDAATAQSER